MQQLYTYIAQVTPYSARSIKNTIALLEKDNTIPFIARYRKEATANLDELAIATIAKAMQDFQALEKRKKAILKAIEQQGKLTKVVVDLIQKQTTLTALEDIYLPYKKTKKTKASIAIEQGYDVLALALYKQNTSIDLKAQIQALVIQKKQTRAFVLESVQAVIAQYINQDLFIREQLRRLYSKQAVITTKVITVEKDTEKAQKYQDYFAFSEPLYRCPSHRLLAILRAESEKIIRIKVAVDPLEAIAIIQRKLIKTKDKALAVFLQQAIEDAYKRLLAPSIANQVLKQAKIRADKAAIAVFSKNLKQLLLAAPLGEKRILAIDPGFKSGCKLVCLDAKGNLEHNETIYPHAPQKQTTIAMKKIRSLVNAYKIEAIAIGNGTASRETERFIQKIGFYTDVAVFIVNESGASVYSASSIARQEFPEYDVTVRGAVSIGRRLSDPLAELVKIDPKSIGVGQYQHDVDAALLQQELDTVVESCVNTVGVNINTASVSLITYVSGIGPSLAKQIVAYRTDNNGIYSREQLLDIPGLGVKAFEQSAAFFKIVGAKNPLDNSAVHPERYALVEKIAKDHAITLTDLIGNKQVLEAISLEPYLSDTIGLPTLTDIINELKKPGLDPRKKAKVFSFAKDITKITDIKEGMELPGIVNNITNFGCFVDIGIKESGLIHISHLSDSFITDVSSVVQLHQQIRVKVLSVDIDRKRIGLSLIDSK